MLPLLSVILNEKNLTCGRPSPVVARATGVDASPRYCIIFFMFLCSFGWIAAVCSAVFFLYGIFYNLIVDVSIIDV